MILGVSPLLARAWKALDDWTNRRACKTVGHQPSWVYAEAMGMFHYPVCARCRERLASCSWCGHRLPAGGGMCSNCGMREAL